MVTTPKSATVADHFIQNVSLLDATVQYPVSARGVRLYGYSKCV